MGQQVTGQIGIGHVLLLVERQDRGDDPGHAAIYAVFNTGPDCVLRVPDTAPAWELVLDTTRPDLSGEAAGPGTRAPAQSVLVFRAPAQSNAYGAKPSTGGTP